MSRTITVQIANHTGETLTFGNAVSSEGPAATANVSSVPDGGVMRVTATNDSVLYGGNEGTFVLTGTDCAFTIFYTHPQGSGTTYVQVQQQTTGYLSGVSATSYSGDPVLADVNLYRGVPVTAPGASTGYAVPLSTDPYVLANNNNCQDFVNSMFGPNMRSPALVQERYNQNEWPFRPADFTGGQLPRVVEVLTKVWMGEIGSGSTDQQILDFLKNFIAGPQLQDSLLMWVPIISYQQNTDPSVYLLEEYSGAPFTMTVGGTPAWDRQRVSSFLTLLVSGAHFVSISADLDFTNENQTNPGRDLYQAFRNSGLSQRGDLGNSHYHGTAPFNTTGEYYLDISGETCPPYLGLLVSLLFGRTVNSTSDTQGTYNTFMQLEGWPAHGVSGGDRHAADYDAYKQTLWNISTYGAAVYSEKRAATVFLAPQGWFPSMYTVTGMMAYVGAYATGTYPNGHPQSWVDTSLALLEPGVTVLPEKYYE